MGKWDKVHAILDKEVDREIKRVLRRIKAVAGGGNGHTKPIKAVHRVVSKRGRTTTIDTTAKKAPTTQRQLHGKYLGLTRTLPKDQKAKLSTLYKEKGVREAVAEARRMRASA